MVVTVCEEDPFPTRLMQAGAAGYMTRARGAGGNGPGDSPGLRRPALYQPADRPATGAEVLPAATARFPFDSLSEREIQIALMIANCHKVQSISDKLCLSPKTVNTYRYRIFEKLSITSDVELALLAVRHGMVDAAS